MKKFFQIILLLVFVLPTISIAHTNNIQEDYFLDSEPLFVKGDVFFAKVTDQPGAMVTIPFEGINGIFGVASTSSGLWGKYFRRCQSFPISVTVQVYDVWLDQRSQRYRYSFKIIGVQLR